MYDKLLDLLCDLDGVRQDPAYHPEGDALFHSLQVFDLARRSCQDRGLWAAALLHDVGKAIAGPDHDEIGADLLEGLVAPRVIWLVRHHLCLLRAPRRTRGLLQGSAALADLERLRTWDLNGRRRDARPPSLEEALDLLLDQPQTLLPDGDPAPFADVLRHVHDHKEARSR